MKQPARLFDEESLPLFSGTAPQGHVEVFIPLPATQQLTLGCPICKGTGEVVIDGRRVRCTCPVGQSKK